MSNQPPTREPTDERVGLEADAQAGLARRLEGLQDAVEGLQQQRQPTGGRSGAVIVLLLIVVGLLAWRDDLGGLRSALGPAQPAAQGASAADALQAADVGPDRSSLEARLDQVVAERNELFGQVVRLRNQVVEQEQRISGLINLHEHAEGLAEEPDVRVSATGEREPDPWLDALDEALRESGLPSLKVVEGRLADGQLHDVLFAELDLLGQPLGVRRVQRLWLTSESGVVYLQLLSEPDPDADPDADPADAAAIVGDAGGLAAESAQPVPERLRLARWDAPLWAATGLELPEVAVPIQDVQAALERLLFGQRLEIVALGGFAGGELLGLELSELDSQGSQVRRIYAPRGVVSADGPTLLLYGGEMVQDGKSRDFYKGRHRVPLPGADHEAWRLVVGG